MHVSLFLIIYYTNALLCIAHVTHNVQPNEAQEYSLKTRFLTRHINLPRS